MTAALSLKEIKSCSSVVRCRLQAASTQCASQCNASDGKGLPFIMK